MGGAADTRLRAACDRCHAQKSRCPRRAGQDVCERCSKAGAACRFSPFREKKDDSGIAAEVTKESGKRKRRRIDLTPTATPESEVGINDAKTLMCSQVTGDFVWPMGQSVVPTEQQMGCDWSFGDADVDSTAFDLEFTLGSGLETIEMTPYSVIDHEENLPALHSQLTPISLAEDINAEVDPSAASDCIKELSALSMDLFEHQQTVPSLNFHGEEYLKPQQNLSFYKLEDTLSLTQRLINVYSSFMSTFMGSSDAKESASKTSTPDQNWQPSPASEVTSNASAIALSSPVISYARSVAPKNIDSASVFLLLSSHLRLNSIYTTLFKHMEGCLFNHGASPKTSQQARFSIPTLKIGNYAPPREQAIPMQFHLLTGMMDSLERWSGILADAIRGFVENVGGGAGEMDMVSSAAENTRVEAQGISERLTRGKIEVLKLGIVV